MRSAHVCHRTRAVRPTESGSKTRAVTDASCSTRLCGMAPAHIRGTFATGCCSALVTNRCGALAMNRLNILRMHRCLARPMSVAHEPAQVEPVIMRNFTPAFSGLMLRNNIVEALASCVRQEVRVLQAPPAKTGRRPLRLQRRRRNSGCRRHFVQIRCARSNCAEYQNKSRNDYT